MFLKSFFVSLEKKWYGSEVCMCSKRNQYECYFVQRLHKSNINLNEIRLRSIWIKLNWETIEVLISTFAGREKNMWMYASRNVRTIFSERRFLSHLLQEKNSWENYWIHYDFDVFVVFWCLQEKRTWNENLFNNLFFRSTWKTRMVTINATTKSFPYYLFTV